MPPCGVELQYFPSKELADTIGQATNSYLFELGKIFNLKRLLRVIVTFDYHQTLASLNRGTETSKVLAATNDDLAIGIAMTPTVMHEGEPRSVIVLNAGHIMPLADPANPENESLLGTIIYTLAHESCHVHDLDVRAINLPDTILKLRLPFTEGVFFLTASGCWDEYIASFMSARFGNDTVLRNYEETFVGALERAKGNAEKAVAQHRISRDFEHLIQQVSEEFRQLMVYAAYLIGHVEGLEGTLEENAPKAIEAVDRHSYFKPFLMQLQAELFVMHDAYGSWASMDVYNPIKKLAHRLLNIGGIEIRDMANGMGHVSIL